MSLRIELDARWGDYECPDCGDALTRWEITSYGRRTFCSCNLRWTHITGDTYIQAERR